MCALSIDLTSGYTRLVGGRVTEEGTGLDSVTLPDSADWMGDGRAGRWEGRRGGLPTRVQREITAGVVERKSCVRTQVNGTGEEDSVNVGVAVEEGRRLRG